MQIYLVGGAIRDKILKKENNDRDFVVTGSTEEEMLSKGYHKVGKHFPVFLHPTTKEEYALARKEINLGNGHGDFKFVFTPDITIKEDSLRRDFTCNALYQDVNSGEIFDFHKGMEDINHRILRHISDHFKEDPLRVLRMCRFAAQLNFSVAPETMELSRCMVKEGMLNYLSKDRIWQELEKALSCTAFHRFIENARECGALEVILPEVETLFHIPERTDYHPEANSGAHTLLTIQAANSDDAMVNYASLLHDIGKIKTDPKCWPSHRGHDKLGEAVIKNIAKRMKVPSAYTDFAVFTAANHMIYHQKTADYTKEIASMAVHISRNQHKEEYLNRFITVLKADLNGRKIAVSSHQKESFFLFENYLRQLVKAASKIRTSEIPGFENMIEGIKNGTLPPSIIHEAYIENLLNENPFVSQ